MTICRQLSLESAMSQDENRNGARLLKTMAAVALEIGLRETITRRDWIRTQSTDGSREPAETTTQGDLASHQVCPTKEEDV